MQLEHCMPNLAEKASIILNEQELRALDIALQQINLRSARHERVKIYEINLDSMSRRNIDGRIFHMESTLLDSPTT